MDLKGKRVIALGERDGVQGESIGKLARQAGAEVLLEVTHCFVWTAAGALDLDGQEEIKRVVDRAGTEGVVVILGTPTAESSELYAVTMTEGDPSWAGALAGEALGLPVYHVTEEEAKAAFDPGLYDSEVGVSEMVLDVEAVGEAVKQVRERASTQPV